LAVCVQQVAHEPRAQPRSVTGEDEQVSADAIQGVSRRRQRVARAERIALNCDRHAVERARAAGRRDDDERIRSDRTSGLDDPVDHAPSEQRVEMLRRVRAHARAEPAGEHHCCWFLMVHV
jgi:hypothetical protein